MNTRIAWLLGMLEIHH